MTNLEFASIVGELAAGINKSLSPESQLVYFRLLGDLPADVFRVAVDQVLLAHPWATFPSIAELREAAIAAMVPAGGTIATEAWCIGWRVVTNTDPEVSGSFERACQKANAPPRVIETLKALGVVALCGGREPIGVVRAQFVKAYAELAERDSRLSLLPASVRKAIERIRIPAASRFVGELVAGVGKEIA